MKPKVQYHHAKEYKRTFAVIAPTREDLLNAIKHKLVGCDAFIRFDLGVAKVHPKETHYVKSVGRDTALWNMKLTEGKLIGYWLDTFKDETHFTVEVDAKQYYFKLSTGKNYSHLYTVGGGSWY